MPTRTHLVLDSGNRCVAFCPVAAPYLTERPGADARVSLTTPRWMSLSLHKSVQLPDGLLGLNPYK